jgi:energy-coupling factor transporter ATP-binding protein EcfA2
MHYILVVIIVKIIFIRLFLLYGLLCNHSFQTNPNNVTNLSERFNYIAPASLFYTFLGAMELVRLGGVQRRWENYIRGEGYEDACNGIDLSTPGEVVVSVPSYENMELYIKENMVHALSGLKGIATPVETGEPYVKLTNLNIQVPPVQLRTIDLNVVPIQTLLSYCPLSVRYAIKNGSQKDAQLSNCSIVFVKFSGLAELEANSTTTNNSSSGSINDNEQNNDSNTSTSGTASGLLALNRAFGTVQNAIYSQKAVLRQFVVDDKGAVAVIVAGFPPYTYSDQPSRAVAVALVIRNRLATFGVDVQIGVTTGTVFCGNVGDENKRCEYAAVGHVVNLSARLMGKDKEGRIICCDSTSKRAGASYVFEKLPEKLKLKGVEHLVEVYTPIRYSMPVSVVNNNNSMSGTNKSNGSNGKNGRNGKNGSNAGLFGREKEMKELLDVLHDDESGKTVLVIGEEGSGKTSLLVRMRSYVVEAEIEARVRHKRSRTISNETTAALQTAMSDSSIVMNSEEDDNNDCYCAITVTAGRVLYKHEPYYAFKSILRDLLGLHLSTSRLDLFKSCTSRSCIKQRALERNTNEDSSNNDNKAASCLHVRSSPVKLTTEKKQPTESKSFKRRRKRQKRSSLMATATEPMQHLLMSHSLRKDIFLLHQILPTLVLPLEISNPGKEEKEKVKKIDEETNIAHRLASIICSLINFHIDALPTLNVFLILVDNAEHLDPYSLALLLEIGKQLPSRSTMILSVLKNAFKTSLDINNTSTATNGMMTTPQKTSNSITKNTSDVFSYDSSSFNFNAMEPPTPSRDLNANFSSIFSRYRSSGNINYMMKRNSKSFGSAKNKNQSNGNQFATNGRRSRGHTMSTSSTEMTPSSVQRVSRARATSSPETIPLTSATTSATCVNQSTSTSTTTPTTPTTQIETKKDRSDSLIRHLNAQKSFINIKNSTETTKRPPPPGMKSKKSSPSMPPGLATNASDINLIDCYTAVPLRARSPTQFDTESSVEETNTESNSSTPRRLHETVTLDTFLIQKDTSEDSSTLYFQV